MRPAEPARPSRSPYRTSSRVGATLHVLPAAAARSDFLDALPHPVWVAGTDGSTTAVNAGCAEYTGAGSAEQLGACWTRWVHPEDERRVSGDWQTTLVSGLPYTADCRLRAADGSYRWHAVSARPLRGEAGAIESWLVTASDIDDRKSLEETLRRCEKEALESQTLLQTIDAAGPIGFKIVDREFRIVRVNERLAAVSGRSAEEHLGRTVEEMNPELWPGVAEFYLKALRGEQTCNVEVTVPSRNDPGSLTHLLSSYFPITTNGETIGVGHVIIDTTERHEAEVFRAVLAENMAEGVCALDRNGAVTYVNRAASKLLGWSAEELCGRRLHELVHYQRADGSPLPSHECDLLEVRTQGRTVRNDGAFTRKDGTIVPVSYSAAPLATCQQIRGVVVVFRDISTEVGERAAVQRQLAELSWIGRIRDAIDEQRLVLYRQPIVPLFGGRPAEELLVRMCSRNGEVVLPGSFIPVAEKYGMIVEIDRWTICRALRRAATTGIVTEVNLSASTIAGTDLLEFIATELAQSGADPANVVFEVTETSLMRDHEAGERFARGLAELGCGLAFDDFGTGFGSLTYLKNFPATHLKIDAQFVRDLGTNLSDSHVVNAVTSLAKAFELETIAEGAETPEVVERLRELGVDYVQGFELGRPEPI